MTELRKGTGIAIYWEQGIRNLSIIRFRDLGYYLKV
jgi:hypothetical protein